MAKILIINGPNLNLLGVREPDVYGRISMDDYLKALAVDYPHVEIDYYQSNHEGDLIDRLHEAGFNSSSGWYRVQCRRIYPHVARPGRCHPLD